MTYNIGDYNDGERCPTCKRLTQEPLEVQLGRKARELMEGMRKRVQRDPDIADFAAGFKEIIAKWKRRKELEKLESPEL